MHGVDVGEIAESWFYLAGILALLALWLFHQLQVRTGRIQAIDVFDRSVERLYLYALPDDRPSCPVCTEAQGRVFLPSRVAKVGFSPLDGNCSGTVPCQGLLIGLYGGWTEARQLVTRIPQSSKQPFVRLSADELDRLVRGAWSKSISADTDRISMHLLEGWCFGKTDQAAAIEGLRYVVVRAKEARHLPYVVPASLRLMELLLKAGREDEARLAIEQFEVRFPADRHDADSPTFAQRKMLQEMKSRLWQTRSLKISA
jgi:hypothetical protein